MNANEALIHVFYTAFQKGDYKTMQSCYHDEATFSDAVFQNLNSKEVKAMWQMLATTAKEIRIEFSKVEADAQKGSCHWEAWYPFSRTGRRVHNVIDASFEFKDGKIFRHRDVFDFWRWSRQALGVSGMLLGWSPIVKNKVRGTARKSLDKFMSGR